MTDRAVAAPQHLHFRSGKKEKMINSVTDYSPFPCKILRRELHSEVRNEGGKAQWLQSWIQWPQSNASFKFGCLWFAFLSVNLEHKKIDDCQKVILYNAVRWNFSLSINLRSVSVNKTHGTGLLLLSVNNHCAKKAAHNSGAQSE